MTAIVTIPGLLFLLAVVGTAVGLMAHLLSGGDALRAHWGTGPGEPLGAVRVDPPPPPVVTIDDALSRSAAPAGAAAQGALCA